MGDKAAGRRLLLLVMALALLAMGAAALWARFASPSLVSSSADAGGARQPPEDAAGVASAVRAMQLARELISSGSPEAARNLAARAHALAPAEAAPLELLGFIEHALGRHAEAAGLFEEALKRRDGARARYSLGVLYTYYLDDPARGRENFAAGLDDPAVGPELAGRLRHELQKSR